MKMELYIDAKELRNKDVVKTITDKQGLYGWWAKREDFDFIFSKLMEKEDKLDYSRIEKDDDFYCIYIGKADNLKKRLVNKHIKGTVRCSTFRKSISSLLFPESSDKNIVNEFIDKLRIKYLPYDNLDYKHDEEKLINEYLRILNIENNNYAQNKDYPLAEKIKKSLSQARRRI